MYSIQDLLYDETTFHEYKFNLQILQIADEIT